MCNADCLTRDARITFRNKSLENVAKFRHTIWSARMNLYLQQFPGDDGQSQFEVIVCHCIASTALTHADQRLLRSTSESHANIVNKSSPWRYSCFGREWNVYDPFTLLFNKMSCNKMIIIIIFNWCSVAIPLIKSMKINKNKRKTSKWWTEPMRDGARGACCANRENAMIFRRKIEKWQWRSGDNIPTMVANWWNNEINMKWLRYALINE